MSVSFFVDAEPVAQPRQRHAVRNGVAVNYLPKDHQIHVFKEIVALRCKEAIGPGKLDGPVHVSLRFLLPRPKSMTWKTKPMPAVCAPGRPDIDNFCKAVLDALNGVAWDDDSQVVWLEAKKQYCGWADTPGVAIEIESM